jgi:hypothetical protein
VAALVSASVVEAAVCGNEGRQAVYWSISVCTAFWHVDWSAVGAFAGVVGVTDRTAEGDEIAATVATVGTAGEATGATGATLRTAGTV